uniref:Ig-like domain-containing protein n=1 Tax=Seriola lalandi dorsalis TaxID=1841481 RepID=A0A3B4WLY9_SERLL
MSDEGSYTLQVENAGGKQEAHFTLTIRKSESKEKVVAPPRVTSPEAKSPLEVVKKEMVHEEVLSSVREVKSSHSQVSITEGQSLTLRANIPGASDIRWILNGVELASSEQYRYGVSGNEQTLTIRSVGQSEQGIITCQAQTQQGLVRCQFDTVLSAKRSDAPHFLVQPRSQNVNEGQNVKFTCELAGEPSPEVEWLKDNMIISVTSNIRLSCSKNVYTLEICEATVADSGKYTIKAKNLFGQCSATSSLNVLTLVEEPTKMIIVEQRASTDAASMQKGFSASSVHMETASVQASSRSSSSSRSAAAQYSFESMSASSMSAMMAESLVSISSSSQMMEMSAHSHVEASSSSASSSLRALTTGIEVLPQEVSAEPGKSLTVAGVFSGDPAPSIQWVRSGRTLPNGDERYHVENTADLSTLVISAVKEDDAGAYTLRLNNELGSDSATVNIHIRSM